MDQSCSGRVFRLIMFLVFLGLAVFITLLLVASKATYQRGVFNKFSVFIGVVAGLDFLFLVVFGWRLSSKQNFFGTCNSTCDFVGFHSGCRETIWTDKKNEGQWT
ncbi:hypothetical protein UL82_00520 [Corynebacterium kutscheri]|uniref:Uncharacterized protein n=1 Tax=Corynebacterium kutscheri TaxID=35755 RepID=A0A0F6TBW9_9CORY|nr:hypothetical protein UL82_00520 [Corynebacterium kutscheri]VEH10735.1 Uncharacterised protein [Corynebacterium kutscheri]